MNTPWGRADSVKEVAPGIKSVSTPGHGGYKLSDERNRLVPEYLRQRGGWYEEDCDWAIVATVFPDCFDAQAREMAEKTIRNWLPDEWERFYGRKLQPGESRMLEERLFYAAHQNDFIGISAVGDWADGVPKGFVRVTATRGGARDPGVEEATFLVPEPEYNARNAPAFVIQPHHKRLAAVPA